MICEVCKERIEHAAKNERDAAIAAAAAKADVTD